MAMLGCEPPRLSESRWQAAGMPVMGSRRALSCEIVQEGVMRRSDAEAGERICKGMSAAVCMVDMAFACNSGAAETRASGPGLRDPRRQLRLR